MGDIDAAALRAGRLTLNSTSGEIRGENLEGTENVTAGNVSGETALTGVQAGTLALSSTSGAVAADGTAETLTCRSVSGAASLTLRSWPAEAEISTVSGGVAVRGPADESGFACVVSTVSGETDCGFDAAEEGGTYTLGAGEAALRISTTSGNVELAPLA